MWYGVVDIVEANVIRVDVVEANFYKTNFSLQLAMSSQQLNHAAIPFVTVVGSCTLRHRFAVVKWMYSVQDIAVRLWLILSPS